MARRRIPDPAVNQQALDRIRKHADVVAQLKLQLASEIAERDNAIIDAFNTPAPPTYEQVSQASDLAPGGLGMYARLAGSGHRLKPGETVRQHRFNRTD